MDTKKRARLHNVADFLAILAGVYVIGTAIGRGPLLSPEAMEAVAQKDTVWTLHIVSGTLALLGIFVADRRVRLGRIILALGGVVLLSSLLFFREFGALAVLGIVVPALLMLGTAPFVRRPIILEAGETPDSPAARPTPSEGR